MDDARLTTGWAASSIASYARPLSDRLFAVGEFVRFQALGGTLILPLVGAASVMSRVGVRGLLLLLGVAGSFHVFAYVLNDVIDLRIDKTQPLRARSPLVVGTIQPWQALATVLLQVPLAFSLASQLGGGSTARWALATSFVGMTIYNLSGKRNRFPPITDFIQGAAWAGLIVFGAAAVSGSPGPVTGALASYVVVFIVMANGVHGSLRDLKNDLACGVRSTAIAFGARTDTEVGIVIPAPLLIYTLALQGVLIGILLFLWVRGEVGNQPVASVGIAASLAVVVGSTFLLPTAIRSVRDEAAYRSAGLFHLIATLTAPILLLAPRMDRMLLAALGVTFLVPLAFHEWLPGALKWSWGHVGWLFQLVRVHNCLAAALATWIGARLAGRTEPHDILQLFLAMGLVGLIVAACNAFNDLRDARIDRLNKPHRPIPSGRISPRAVSWLVAVFASCAIAAAWSLGRTSGAVATTLLGLALWYSISLKNTVLIGNAAVGFLAACTVLYGGLVVGRITWAIGFAAIAIFLGVLSGEILKTIADRGADAAAGYRTIGTSIPLRRALVVHAVVACGFIGTVIMPWLGGFASTRYLLTVMVAAVLPIAGVVVLVNRPWTDRSIRAALLVTKTAWFTGLLSLTLLA